MPYVTLRDGNRLHVRVIGRGQPVLMLHGMGMEGAHWLPFVLPYIARYRFYLPDLRGAGKSRELNYNQPDIFRNLAEDTEDVIRQLQLQDFLLVGYSLGGSTALHLLREHGFHGVRRYLHIDQSPWVGSGDDWRHGLGGEGQAALFLVLREIDAQLARHPAAKHLRDLPTEDLRALAQRLAQVFAPMFAGTALDRVMSAVARAPALFARIFPLANIADLRATLNAYLSGGHDYRDDLRGCDTPVTVFVGMDSPLYAPSGQMQIASLVRDGRVVRFNRSGHEPLVNEPLKFILELGRFLRGA
jgi:non-heme chloroperoxidase